jgi:hypothetical protein
MNWRRFFLLPMILILAACAAAPSEFEKVISNQVTPETQSISTPEPLTVTTPISEQPGSNLTFDFILRFTPAPTETLIPPLELPKLEEEISSPLQWEGRPTYLAESRSGYLFRVLFDPKVWGLVIDNSGFTVLGHREITYCMISPSTSRGLSLDTVVEHEARKLGAIVYEINSVYSNGQKQFVTFVGGDGLIFTGFEVNFKEQADDCLSDVEIVLSTLRSIPETEATVDR